MPNYSSDNLEARLDRLEALHMIGQLPIRYALAVDARDVDTWVGLFIDDVNCGRHGTGRGVLRGIIEADLRTCYRTIHQLCGHRIELDGADLAHGVTYCRAEHEDRGKWIVMAIAYFDDYARRDGEWFFVRRREKHWYSADWEQRPTAPFNDWPGRDIPARLPQDFASWRPFWDRVDPALVADLSRAPL